jgi:hypothetical protein
MASAFATLSTLQLFLGVKPMSGGLHFGHLHVPSRVGAQGFTVLFTVPQALPYPRRLVAGSLPRRTPFDPGSSHVESVVDRAALGQAFPSTSFPLTHNHYHHHPGLVQNKKTNSVALSPRANYTD